MADRTISVDLVGHDRSAGKTLTGVGDSAEHATGKLGKLKAMAPLAAAGMAGLAVGGLAVGKQLFDTALQTELMGNKAKTVFGKDFPRAEANAKQLATRLGMTTTETQGLLAGFGDLLTPMGFTTDKAVTLSGDMGTLTAALSQWSGGTRSAADVGDMLSDALTGEYDSLKSLGIQLDQDKVKGLLAAQGKDKLTGAALDQATAEVALKEIMKQSSNAMTAYEKGTNKAATQQLKLTSRLKELKEKGAKALLPAFTALLGGANKLFDWFEKLRGKGSGLSGSFDKLKAAGSAVSRWWTTYLAPPLKKAADELFPALKDTFKQLSGQFSSGGTTMKNLGAVANALGVVLGKVVIPVMVWLYKTHLKKIVIMAKAVAIGFNGIMAVGKAVFSAVVTQIGWVIDAAAKAFGWIPGLGPKLRKASADFKRFRDSVNRSINGIRSSKTVRVNTRLSVSYGNGDAARYYRNNGTTVGLPARAMGGPVKAGAPYLVGERGPELVVPGADGQVMTAAQTRRLLADAARVPSTTSARPASGVATSTVPGATVLNVKIYAGTLVGNSREMRELIVSTLGEASRRGIKVPGVVTSTRR